MGPARAPAASFWTASPCLRPPSMWLRTLDWELHLQMGSSCNLLTGCVPLCLGRRKLRAETCTVGWSLLLWCTRLLLHCGCVACALPPATLRPWVPACNLPSTPREWSAVLLQALWCSMLCRGRGTTQGTRSHQGGGGIAWGYIPWSTNLQRDTKPISFVWSGAGTGSRVAQAGLQLMGLQVCCPIPSQGWRTVSRCLNTVGVPAIINGCSEVPSRTYCPVLVWFLFCFHFEVLVHFGVRISGSPGWPQFDRYLRVTLNF